MFPIPFYYVWSPKQKIFHDVLQDSLKAYPDLFDVSGTFFSQEDFDAMAKANGNAFQGWTQKIDRILELLHTHSENSWFIFSDADVIFFPKKQIRELMSLQMNGGADLVCLREAVCSKVRNVGFLLIKVCEANRILFLNCLTKMKSGPGMIDQGVINDELATQTGVCHYFPPEFVMTSSTVIDQDLGGSNRFLMRNPCMIFQALCDGGDVPSHVKIAQKLHQQQILGIPLEKYSVEVSTQNPQV